MVFVAFLRAVNLVRVNRVPMGELRRALTDAGFTDVTTYLQSGNVVLTSTKRSPAAVSDAVEQLLRDELGVDTDVIVRTGGALAKVARAHPLARQGAVDRALHVAFLQATPSAAARRALAGRAVGDDEYLLRGTEVYLRYPHGVARSKLNVAIAQGVLGTPATVRTWKVVTRLAELARP